MESINKIIGIFLLGLLCLSLACGNGGSEPSQSGGLVSDWHQDSSLPDLLLSASQQTGYYLDGQPFFPNTTEGFIKPRDGRTQITLASHFGTEGFFFELNIPQGTAIKGHHYLNGTDHTLTYNAKKEGDARRYSCDVCPQMEGWVHIHSFNEESGRAGGYFYARVCQRDSSGQMEGKWLRKGVFRDVMLKMVGGQ